MKKVIREPVYDLNERKMGCSERLLNHFGPMIVHVKDKRKKRDVYFPLRWRALKTSRYDFIGLVKCLPGKTYSESLREYNKNAGWFYEDGQIS